MSFLIDSNIIIYSFSDEYAWLRNLVIDKSASISEITRVEVLGFGGLKKDQEMYFRDIFSFTPMIIPNLEVFDKAIEVRKKYNLKLGDSIIAATALVHGLDLCTRNLKDFDRIGALNCVNPIS